MTRPRLVLACLLLLALAPPAAAAAGQDYYIEIFARILIMAIAAVSLDLILGYGGMVSFGHAAYLGVGAYAMAIMSHYGVHDLAWHLTGAILASAISAFFIGLVSLRTAGVYFIMITLAFCQMLYYLAISLKQFGGDDGMMVSARSTFFGLDLANEFVFYYLVLAILGIVLFLCSRIVRSRFGMVLRGAKSNERKMIALSYPTFRYRLLAFVIAGAICGVAGALLANLTTFASPSLMSWTRSGELMIMVLLGGMGTLLGPVLGAVVVMSLEIGLAGLTRHWPVIMGPFFILAVLFARRGLLGIIEGRRAGS